MTRTSLLTLVLVALAASPAASRDRVNATDRLIRDPDHGRAVSGRDARETVRVALPAAASRTALAVPLSAGAVQLDSTWYDLQDMGSLGNRIQVGLDGRVHVTWQDEFCELGGGCPPNLNAPQPHPNRGMAYALRDVGGTWAHHGKVRDPSIPACCVPDLVGGFGALALAPDGRAVIAQHLNEDGCDLRGTLHVQSTPGSSTWDAQISPVVAPSLLFPQAAARPQGGFTMLGEVPRGGLYDETEALRTSWLPAAAASYSCFTWSTGAWTTFLPTALLRDGRPAFPSIAAASDGRVGVAVTDFGGNVFLVESSNGTFAPPTLTVRVLTTYADAQVTATDSTSLQYRPSIHCHIAYNDTTPHVVWSELQARRNGGSVVYSDHRSRIRMWSPVRGLETVYQVPAGVADRYDDLDQGLAGPIAGFNTLSVDWPQVGFSADGLETYVAWLRFTDAQIDPTADAGLPGVVTGIGFGDIASSVTRPGQSWSSPQNLTDTPNTDERFFSLATRNPGARAHLVFQASATDQAGSSIIGDRGATPGNLLRRIAYLERPLTASVLDAPLATTTRRPVLGISPNPVFAPSRATFTIEAASTPRVLRIVDVAGRTVADLELPAGESTIRWEGRRDDGRAAPTGVYFARVAGAIDTPAARFVLAQ